jgi:hypothetical protein
VPGRGEDDVIEHLGPEKLPGADRDVVDQPMAGALAHQLAAGGQR